MSKTSGLWRFSALGYVLRAMQVLPAASRRKLLSSLVSKDASAMPPFQGMLRFLEAAGPGALPGLDIQELGRDCPELATVTITDVAISGPNGVVNAKLYRGAANTSTDGFVWVHGGAFVGGDIDSAEAQWPALVLAQAGIPVLSLSYRKALKGVRYPVPSDDVLAGWNWAASNKACFGGSIQRFHLGGASAGGNLTAGVCKRLRDGAGAVPASLVLVYPLLHRELPDEPPGTLAAVQQRVPGAYFSQPWIDDCVLNYVGEPSMLDDPYATPAMGFVGNQPPVLIINCELDSLKVSGEDYARRLQAAGVRVRVETLRDALHGCVGDPKAVGGTQCLSIMRSWLQAEAADRAAIPSAMSAL